MTDPVHTTGPIKPGVNDQSSKRTALMSEQEIAIKEIYKDIDRNCSTNTSIKLGHPHDLKSG